MSQYTVTIGAEPHTDAYKAIAANKAAMEARGWVIWGPGPGLVIASAAFSDLGLAVGTARNMIANGADVTTTAGYPTAADSPYDAACDERSYGPDDRVPGNE